jgi:hypothetical protein
MQIGGEFDRMRRVQKWVVAGVALVAVGVSAYLFSQPRKGTVEDHKLLYLRAASREPFRIHAKNLWERLRGSSTRHLSAELVSYEDQEKHQRKLIKLGYLIEREFVVSNRPAEWVADDVMKRRWVRERTGKRVDEDFSDVSDRGTNVVVVICRAKDLLVFSNEVRQADIPPSE